VLLGAVVAALAEALVLGCLSPRRVLAAIRIGVRPSLCIPSHASPVRQSRRRSPAPGLLVLFFLLLIVSPAAFFLTDGPHPEQRAVQDAPPLLRAARRPRGPSPPSWRRGSGTASWPTASSAGIPPGTGPHPNGRCETRQLHAGVLCGTTCYGRPRTPRVPFCLAFDTIFFCRTFGNR